MEIPVVKQINDFLWYLRRRQERRWLQRNVEWWGQKRAAGRSRYVRWFAVRWGLSQAIIWSAWFYFADGSFSFWLTPSILFLALGLGWSVGTAAWADNERLYERAKRGESSEAGPDRG